MLAGLLISTFALAQTQAGIVKTRGRKVNGQMVPGQRLSKALIEVEGINNVLSDDNGAFSFRAKAKTYVIKNVTKNDYELVDVEVCGSHECSTDSIPLVMEKSGHFKLEMTKRAQKIREELSKDYQRKLDSLETLQDIADDRLQALIDSLDSLNQANEKIAKELAKYYVSLDYDQLNEQEREDAELMEKGELDIMLQRLRARGDMDQRIREHRRHQEQAQRELESDAADCFKYYQCHLTKHKNDSALAYLQRRTTIDTLRIDWQEDLARFFSEYMAQYTQAMDCYQHALRLSTAQYGPQHERTASCLVNIGAVYEHQGRYDEALDSYNQALAIKKQVLGKKHIGLATCLNNMGNVYNAMRDYAQALKSLEMALDLRRKELGENSSDVAGTLNNIGSVYRNKKDYQKALEYYLQALAIRQGQLDQDDPATAVCLNNVGITYQYLKQPENALEYHRLALDIREKVLGRYHPLVAASMANIGTLHYQQGLFKEALDELLNATKIREKMLGPLHPSTGNTYNNVGAVYDAQGDYIHAMEYYQKALTVFQAQPSPNVRSVEKLQQKIEAARKKIETQ